MQILIFLFRNQRKNLKDNGGYAPDFDGVIDAIDKYSRVIIRDVKTLEPVRNGQIGLVNLITPMVKATPVLSVMADGLGILHDGERCGCGISNNCFPYMSI